VRLCACNLLWLLLPLPHTLQACAYCLFSILKSCVYLYVSIYIYLCILLCSPCLNFGFLVRLPFALHSFALFRVCAIAPSFVSGWRAFSSVSLCKSIFPAVTQLYSWAESSDNLERKNASLPEQVNASTEDGVYDMMSR
jgi:hypothetical protein